MTYKAATGIGTTVHTYSNFPIFFLQALGTKDFSFLQSLLLATTPHATDLPATLQTSSSAASAVDAQVHWLEAFMQSLWEKNAFEASAHAGLVVAWHLNNMSTGLSPLL